MCNSMRPALWKSLWNIRFHPKVKWEYPQQCIKTCSIKGLQRLILFCQRRFQNASNDIPIPTSHIQKPKLMDELQLACLQHGTRRYGENFWLFLILKTLTLKTFWGCCTPQPYPSLKETNGHITFVIIFDQLMCLTAAPITPITAFTGKWFLGRMPCFIVPACTVRPWGW